MVRGFAPGLEPPPLPPPVPPGPVRRHAVTLGLAVLGGFFAVVGAFIEESRGASPLLVILLAPTIEEVLKPSGVIWIFEKRPHFFLSAGHVVLLCVVGALVFATLENLLYIYVYLPGSAVAAAERGGFIRFRFLVCTALHVTCSAIMGVGLARQLRRIRKEGVEFDMERSLPYIITAIAIHAQYNLAVTILESAGWRPWS